MTRAERGWLAGILDGEGTIAAWHADRQHATTKAFHRQIVFYNTDPRIMEKVRVLVEELTGTANMRVYAVAMSHYEGAYDRYSVHVTTAHHIVVVLRKLLPDLVGKKDQAILMLEHLAWRQQFGNPSPNRYPEEVYRRDKMLIERLSYLNRHGPRTRRGHTEDAAQSGEDMVPSPE